MPKKTTQILGRKHPYPLGKIHPPKTLFLRNHAGSASLGKKHYDLSYGMSGVPIVWSRTTRKWFTMSWSDILNLAVAAGIDEVDG